MTSEELTKLRATYLARAEAHFQELTPTELVAVVAYVKRRAEALRHTKEVHAIRTNTEGVAQPISPEEPLPEDEPEPTPRENT